MYLRICFFFLILATCLSTVNTSSRSLKKKGLLLLLKHKIESKITKFVDLLTLLLEKFNDKHLGASGIGHLLSYQKIKPYIGDEHKTSSRTLKKMPMALMPLMFHIGASSTWMLLTMLLAAKSVAIGLLLLVMKIAVSSAKVASFFTLLKAKQIKEHLGSHGPTWSQGHGHGSHGYDLYKSDVGWKNSYTVPEWNPSDSTWTVGSGGTTGYKKSDGY